MARDIPDRLPPASTVGVPGWIRANLLCPWYNALLTAGSLWLIWKAASPFWSWAVTNASVTLDPEIAKQHAGAAWGFIRDMWPVFMTGIYPAGERWRPLLALVVVLAMACLTLWPRLRRSAWLRLAWLATPVVIFACIRGGGPTGLAVVGTHYWGGLMLTILLSVTAMTAAFPLSVLLALGRTSNQPVTRPLCVAYIELIRGVPLISILFMASVVLPLFLPVNMELDKLLRAMVGITMFFSAYLAENIRGGLQGLSRGQYEAADAPGHELLAENAHHHSPAGPAHRHSAHGQQLHRHPQGHVPGGHRGPRGPFADRLRHHVQPKVVRTPGGGLRLHRLLVLGALLRPVELQPVPGAQGALGRKVKDRAWTTRPSRQRTWATPR